MTIKADFHIHTNNSTDSSELPVNHVLTAIDAGFTDICFTDHNDFDYPVCDGQQDFQLDFDSYCQSILEVKNNFRDKINIYTGVEQGLTLTAADRINSYDPNGLLDFIIGSSHMVYNEDPYYPEFWNKYDISHAITAYYESVAENIKHIHNYDVYGHLDYIIRYIPDKKYNYNSKQHMDIIEHILKELISHGKGIEINTAGLRYGLAHHNPSPDIISLYRQLGGDIITIGSDAHVSSHLGNDFDIAAKTLHDAGFEYYTIFSGRKPEFIKL